MIVPRIKARDVDLMKRSGRGEPLNLAIYLYDGSKTIAVIDFDSVAQVRRLHDTLGNIILNHAEDMEAEL